MIRDGVVYRYLTKRVRRCPVCGDRGRVQIIVYGMPAVHPTLDEEDRAKFAGCIVPSYEDPEQEPPDRHCPTCDLSYTKQGEVVPDLEGW